MVLIGTPSGQDWPKTPSRSDRPAASSILKPIRTFEENCDTMAWNYMHKIGFKLFYGNTNNKCIFRIYQKKALYFRQPNKDELQWVMKSFPIKDLIQILLHEIWKINCIDQLYFEVKLSALLRSRVFRKLALFGETYELLSVNYRIWCQFRNLIWKFIIVQIRIEIASNLLYKISGCFPEKTYPR